MYLWSAVLILPALLLAEASVGGIGVKGSDRSVVGIAFKMGAKRDDTFVVGTVFEDLNKDGRYEEGREPGIPGVMVSNGRDVVLTNARGQYKLLNIYDHGKNPTEPGAMTVFISKPAGCDVPVDADNVPQFFYYYIPYGSPRTFGGSHFASAVCRPAGHCPGASIFRCSRASTRNGSRSWSPATPKPTATTKWAISAIPSSAHWLRWDTRQRR